MIEELLQNPEQYRIGDDYRGTNIVFPVEFGDEKLVVKKPRFVGSLINVYYVFQDKFFHGTRRVSTGKQRLQREARCLERLDGLHSPELVAYEDGVLVRRYLEGTDFRGLSGDTDRQRALEDGFDRLMEIHGKDVVVGDAHVKNIFVGDGIYWMDFDGVFDESDFNKAKAIDVLKFVYSTYSATRNNDATTYSAELASKRINGEVKDSLRGLVGLSASRLWFPTRLPLDGKLNEEIKKILC